MPTTAIASTDITGNSTTLLLQDSIAIAPSTTTGSATTATNLGSMMSAAIAGGYMAHSTGTNYIVTSPIVIHIDSTIQGPLGIDLGGSTIVSQITNVAPVIEIDVGPGVDVRYMTLSNFTIQGNGHEGDGIKIVADGNDRWLYNWNINNVTVNNVGGYGLDVQGSVSEGLVSNSWMNGNGAGGAYFSHSANGGVASALRWFGGGFEGNGGDGLTLDNGTRDMSVDGATFADNNGVGIAAGSGITSVTGSEFQDNHGVGIWFQGFGNFNDDTFTTSGSQALGIKGYLVGNATLIGNTSIYTGAGPDPTALANFQGSGNVFTTGDSGALVTGTNVAVSPVGDGDLAHVGLSNQGVALPALAPVTAATPATGTGTDALATVLTAAMAGGYVAHLTDTTYTVTSPIVINVTNTNQGAFGIDLGGAKIISEVGSGQPVIEIVVGAGVTLSSLTLSNFSINGSLGDGIRIAADGTDRAISMLSINNVSVEHVAGIGLDVMGSVSRALVVDSWMNGNDQGGARFANSPAGGVASGLEWEGGGFRLNGVAGMILDNGAHDMVVKGAYFVDNHGPGIDATSGITLVQASGFENNQGSGAIVQGPGNFTDDTFSTWGPQTTAVGGYLAGGKVTLTGVSNEYYGSGADPTVLANIQGNGTLAIAGTGTVLVGSNIAVTGADPVVGLTTTATTPTATERLASDTGLSPTDKITSNATLIGTADGGAVVHFAVDGSADAATATADANGTWSYTPTGLADGVHSVVASETNAWGTGTASLSFTLDTTAPSMTEKLASGGTTSSSAALAGTGDPQATVHFTIDGNATTGTATADATGAWSYTPTGLANGTHTIVASETDLAGNTGTASLTFTLDSVTTPVVTERLASDTGSSSTDRTTSNPTLTGTADPHSLVHFTVDGSAVAATATANANGAWTYTPTGLVDGMHTIVASETNAAGTGTASLAFTLDTTAPVLTEQLANGSNVATLTGAGDANAVVHFVVDGGAIADTATADAGGHWSFTPSGLVDGAHTVVASETDLAGNTGSASLTFTLQTEPTFTGMVPANGSVLLAGNAGEAGDVVEIYDGSNWIGGTTTDANGAWSYTASAASNVIHSFGFNVYDQGGGVIHGANKAILGSSKADTLAGTTGNDIISANGGNDTIVGRAGGDQLTGGSGKDTFAYGAVTDSTPSAADTITDFQHGLDKIDFTNIAGIKATNGVPRFQGNITGNGNLTLNAHSVAYLEVGGNTQVLVNTTNAAETVTTSDTHASSMEITLVGVHLGLTSTDFHHT